MNKIFGIGAHKTATGSLSAALNILGIKCSHWEHHKELYEGIKKNNFKLRNRIIWHFGHFRTIDQKHCYRKRLKGWCLL